MHRPNTKTRLHAFEDEFAKSIIDTMRLSEKNETIAKHFGSLNFLAIKNFDTIINVGMLFGSGFGFGPLKPLILTQISQILAPNFSEYFYTYT